VRSAKLLLFRPIPSRREAMGVGPREANEGGDLPKSLLLAPSSVDMRGRFQLARLEMVGGRPPLLAPWGWVTHCPSLKVTSTTLNCTAQRSTQKGYARDRTCVSLAIQCPPPPTLGGRRAARSNRAPP